VTVLAIV
jgi:hypothetical protein